MEPSGMSRASKRAGGRRALLFWFLLLTLTLALRLLRLEPLGIWQDEGLTLYQVRLPFGEILANRIPVAQFITQNTVPPLYFLLLGAWGRLLGFGLWSLRLFGVFSSLLVSVLLYRAGAWMGSRRTGFLAALLGALSPLYLWYAQELRMYTFLLLPATLSFGLLWKWYERGRRGARAWPWALGYALAAGTMAWTHYLAFFLIAAQGLWLAVVLLRHRPRLLLGTGAVLLLVALPLIPFGVERFLGGAERDFFFRPAGFIVNNLLHSFSFGVPIFMSDPAQVLPLFPLAWALLALGGWQAWRRGGWPLLLLLAGGLALPVLALYAASYVKPLYQNARHLIFVSPAFYLLWAFGLERLAAWRRWLPLLVLPFLLYGWLPAITHYFAKPETVKNDVRPLFEYLAEEVARGDVVALNDPVLQHALEYFAPGVPWVVLPPYGTPIDEATALPAYEQVARENERVWFVYGPPDSSFDTADHVYQWFDTHYTRMGYIEFPGQTVVGAAEFDTQGPLYGGEVLPAALPMEATFAETIHFRGLFEALPAVPAGERAVIETLWAVGERQPAEDWQVVLRLSDAAGRGWYQQQINPYQGLHRTSHWQPAQQLRLPLSLRLPATLPPARYRLELFWVDAAGHPLFPLGSESPLLLSDAFEVTRAAEPAVLGGVSFGGALRVEPAPLPAALPPAPTFTLSLLVTVAQPGAMPDRWELVAETVEGEVVWTLPLPLEAGLPAAPDGTPQLPTGGWQRGDALELRYEVPLPPEFEGGYRFLLRAKRGEATLDVPRWGGLLHDSEMLLGRYKSRRARCGARCPRWRTRWRGSGVSRCACSATTSSPCPPVPASRCTWSYTGARSPPPTAPTRCFCTWSTSRAPSWRGPTPSLMYPASRGGRARCW